MPFVEPTGANERYRRVHITGETYTGKTHSLLSFPAPRVILNYPGEGGYDTIPKDDPQTVVKVWAPNTVSAEANSLEVIEEVRTATVAALNVPGLMTFAGDGLHKLMAYVMDAMSGGKFFEGARIRTETRDDTDVVDPRTWGAAERWMVGYLDLIKQSKVPYVVVTSWDADKQERRARQGEKWTEVPTRKLPALYGGIARTVLGEFAVTVHSSWGRIVPTDAKPTWRWQTKPDALVMGCGIKAPAEVAGKIPKYVKAEWGELAKHLNIEPTKGDAR